MPLGCGGIEQAPPPAHASTDGPRIPRITEDRLRACVSDYAEQLEERPHGINAKVQVDEAGRTQNVILEGIPDTAPDFAACTRVALRDMAVPSSVLRLRPGNVVGSTNGKTVSVRNELGNVVVVGVFLLLGELAVEYGGYTILFAISVELVHEAARALSRLSDECRQVKEVCIISCGASELPTGRRYGIPFHRCLRECMEAAGCFYDP